MTSKILPDGTDLNTVVTPGIYQVKGGSTALHYPSGSNGILVVIKAPGYNLVRQFIFRLGTIDSNDMYWFTRQIDFQTPVYGTWKQIDFVGGSSNVVETSVVTTISVPTAISADSLVQYALNTPTDANYNWYMTNIWINVQSKIIPASINHNGAVKLLFIDQRSSDFNITAYFIGIHK